MVTSATTSRRLRTSLVTIHSRGESFRELLECLQKYSMMDFFSLTNRAMIRCWLVHLLGRDEASGENVTRTGAGRERRERFRGRTQKS